MKPVESKRKSQQTNGIITQFLFHLVYFIFAEFVAEFHYISTKSGSEFGEVFLSPNSLAEIGRRIARRIHQVPNISLIHLQSHEIYSLL